MRFGHCADEPLERDGLEQVVHHVQVKPVQRIFFIRCCKDHHWRVLQRFEELDACNIGHFDVQEDQVHGLLLQITQRQRGILECADLHGERRPCGEIFDDLESQRLIVKS